MEIGAQIIRQHDVFFDGGDTANGSLYLCAVPGAAAGAVTAAIEKLRSAGLWSAQPHKQVPETQKDAYAQQMRFIECFAFESSGTTLAAARYDHPKYPSDAKRWQRWREVLAG